MIHKREFYRIYTLDATRTESKEKSLIVFIYLFGRVM